MRKVSGECMPVKKLFFCCDIDSETILLIIACVVLHIAFIHLYTWIIYCCVPLLIPHVLLLFFYFLGGLFLLLGVLLSFRFFIAAFPWIMLTCLLGNVAYVIMLCIDQKCICKTLADMTSGKTFHFAVYIEFYILGLIPGINFVITFYLMLLVADYLAQNSE